MKLKLLISQLENESRLRASRLKMLLILAIEKMHWKDQVISRLFWFCWRKRL